MSRVTDGATLRQTRITDMLAMIRDSEGATTLEIQGFMLARHGLKFKTTSDYLHEIWMAGMIVEDTGRWIVTDKLKRLFGAMKK